jgi:hypothetical protein
MIQVFNWNNIELLSGEFKLGVVDFELVQFGDQIELPSTSKHGSSASFLQGNGHRHIKGLNFALVRPDQFNLPALSPILGILGRRFNLHLENSNVARLLHLGHLVLSWNSVFGTIFGGSSTSDFILFVVGTGLGFLLRLLISAHRSNKIPVLRDDIDLLLLRENTTLIESDFRANHGIACLVAKEFTVALLTEFELLVAFEIFAASDVVLDAEDTLGTSMVFTGLDLQTKLLG